MAGEGHGVLHGNSLINLKAMNERRDLQSSVGPCANLAKPAEATI